MRNLNEVKVWTAIVTPLTDGGELDLVSFEGLLRKQEKAGNGVVVAGSTGEGLALSTQQKQILVQTATRLGLQIPVIAGVGGFALEECKNWIRWCESEGVDGFLLVTPVYAKPGAEGQSAWFQSLMDASSLPCMIYNVPGRSAVKLHPEALRRISQHENFWAVKESSGSIAEFLQYRALAPHARFYCGDDALMPFFASAGAVGLVSVAANVWPEATRKYAELALQGQHGSLLPLWSDASNALFSASNPVPVKALLARKGWIRSPGLLPPLSDLDMSGLDPLLEMDLRIQEWLGATI